MKPDFVFLHQQIMSCLGTPQTGSQHGIVVKMKRRNPLLPQRSVFLFILCCIFIFCNMEQQQSDIESPKLAKTLLNYILWQKIKLKTKKTQVVVCNVSGVNISAFWLFSFKVESETTGQSGPWLQDCVVSLSPCSDLLVVAREHKAAFLSGQISKQMHTLSLVTM